MKKIFDYSIKKNHFKQLKLIILDHINILTIHQIKIEKYYNKIILIEEFGEKNLKSYLNQNKILNLNLIKSYFYQLLSAINFFHINNIIHNNLKLKNIFIFQNGLIKISNSKINFKNKNYNNFNDLLEIIFIIIKLLFLNNLILFKIFKKNFIKNNNWKFFLKFHLLNNIDDFFLDLLDLILNNKISAFKALNHFYFNDINQNIKKLCFENYYNNI